MKKKPYFVAAASISLPISGVGLEMSITGRWIGRSVWPFVASILAMVVGSGYLGLKG